MRCPDLRLSARRLLAAALVTTLAVGILPAQEPAAPDAVADREGALNDIADDAPDALFQDLGSALVFGVHRGDGECAV